MYVAIGICSKENQIQGIFLCYLPNTNHHWSLLQCRYQEIKEDRVNPNWIQHGGN